MPHLRAFYLLPLGLLTSSDALAQRLPATPIQFSYLKAVSPGENSSLSGECDGTSASAEIVCRFTQISIRYRLNPKDLSVELEKRLSALRAEASRDPKKYADAMCSELRKNQSELHQKVKELTNPNLRSSIQDMLDLCANPSMPALEAWIRRATIAETKACRVSVFQNDPVTFKKVAEHKWVANVGPQGLCSSVYLYTMEREPKYQNLWRWSQTRTFADRSGELCKDTQLNFKLEFSWRGEEPDLACETVSFGM